MSLKNRFHFAILLATLTFSSFISLNANPAPDGKTNLVITGRVLDESGKPMLRADVYLMAPDMYYGNSIKAAKCDESGNFKIVIDSAGTYSLGFAGVYHRPYQIDFPVQAVRDSIDLTINLVPQQTTNRIKKLSIVLSDKENGAQYISYDLVKEKDGSFSAEIPAGLDSIAYQVTGFMSSYENNLGTQQDYILPDEYGYYLSVIQTQKKATKVVFQPSKFAAVKNIAQPIVVFNYDKSGISQIVAAKLFYETESAELSKRMTDFIRKTISDSKSSFASEFLVLKYLSTYYDMSGIDPAFSQSIVRTIAPESSAWSSFLESISTVADNLDLKDCRKFIVNIFEKNTDIIVKSQALYYLKDQSEIVSADEYLEMYKQLEKLAGNNQRFLSEYKMLLNPIDPVKVGSVLPDFELTQLGGKNTKVTKDTFKGKYFLLDFWGTWCMPCVEEIPNFEKAYKKFKSKNFEIFSVAQSETDENVTTFRKEKYKMPWKHAIPDEAANLKITSDFNVQAIPKLLLVSPDGVILAVDEDLRGEKLEKTLEKFLK